MKAYTLGDWAIHPETNGLVRGDTSRKLESRVMQMLVYFCENPSRVISRAELMEAVWGTTALSPNSVSVAIGSIRQALGDDARDPRYIETHQKLGYRLLIQPRVLGRKPGSRAKRVVVAASVLGLLAASLITWSLLRESAQKRAFEHRHHTGSDRQCHRPGRIRRFGRDPGRSRHRRTGPERRGHRQKGDSR